MGSSTVVALLGFVSWTLFLLILMEVMRVWWVVAKQFPANEFKPDNANLSPFFQRLTRAHANCIEGFPIFAALLVIALITEQTTITDPLAYVFLAARIVQSLAHLLSLSMVAVHIRFTFFLVQLVIGVYWLFELVSVLIQ